MNLKFIYCGACCISIGGNDSHSLELIGELSELEISSSIINVNVNYGIKKNENNIVAIVTCLSPWPSLKLRAPTWNFETFLFKRNKMREWVIIEKRLRDLPHIIAS